MPAFNGQLRSNEIFSALYNMVISQQVFADNLGKHQTLVDKARTDGGLYGDTKLYYATDVLKSAPWGNDAEATNLLKLNRPEAPECQAIYIDQFRQISLTVDNYLTKRAWSTESAFSSFNSVMLGWIGETKKVYDGTLYNTFIGTTVSPSASQNITVPIAASTTGMSGIEKDKKEAMTIAESLANLFVKMGDYSRDYNDYGNFRSYAYDDIRVIWNSDYVNKIRKIDLPTIFHKDGLMDKFEEEVLPSRYFGTVASATVSSASNDGSYRSLYETEYEVSSATADPRAVLNPEDNKYYVHVFSGDNIPESVEIAANEAYTVDSNVICKVLVKMPPYLSAFEVGTSFFNPKSLTENHYLTWGHNTLEYLKNYPFITVKKG